MDYYALQAVLETRGLADTDGFRRRATPRRCSCRAMTLCGLDADIMGLPVTVDVIDLDRGAEALARLAGRATFTVWQPPAGGFQVNSRTAFEIRSSRQDRPVVCEHRCGQPPPASTAFRWRVPRTSPTGECPF